MYKHVAIRNLLLGHSQTLQELTTLAAVVNSWRPTQHIDAQRIASPLAAEPTCPLHRRLRAPWQGEGTWV